MKFLISILFLYFLFFLLYPLLFITQESFIYNGQFTLSGFISLLSLSGLRSSLLNSFLLSALTTLFSITIGTLLAYIFQRFSFRGKTLFKSLFFLPLIIPPFIGAVGIQKILSRFGPINIFLLEHGIITQPIDWIVGVPLFGMILLQSLHFFPLVFFSVSSALTTFDYQLIQAGMLAGAKKLRIFLIITLPLLSPALFSSGSLIAIGSFTDVGTPLVFEYRQNIAVKIYDMLNESTGNPVAYALVLSTALLTLSIFLISRKIETCFKVKTKSKGVVPIPESKISAIKNLMLYCGLIVLSFFSLLPHLSMILLSISSSWSFTIFPDTYSLNAYQNIFSHPLATRSIFISLGLSIVACLITSIFGVLLGIIIEKKTSTLSPIFDFLVMLPIAIPGIIVAFGYFGGFADTLLDPRINPFPLLALGYSIRRLPYVVRNVVSSLSFQSESLKEVADICGGSRYFTFREITLKLILPALSAGVLLCFSYSMIEVSESLVLALSEKTYPISKAMYALIARPDGIPLAATLGVLIMSISLFCSIISNRLSRTR